MLSPQVPNVISYEVEFLAVGENSKSGDAIVCSWLERTGRRRILVVDGGYQATGEKIVQLVHDRFGTDFIDIVVSTHPDDDHANGLVVVLEECLVGELLMHQPWMHGVTGASLFPGGRFSDRSLRTEAMKSLDAVRILAEQALEAGVPATEPFTGLTRFDGVIEILGPTVEFYESLMPDFRSTGSRTSSLSAILAKAGTLATKLRESLDIETLTDSGETSAENNSSTVVQLNLNGQRVLLTGDAGIPALERVADRLEGTGRTTDSLRLAQVPHHGSKRNVGPSVLDRLLGLRLGRDLFLRPAVVSAAPDGEPKHPAKQVTNAFRRRGTPVFATQGINLRVDYNAPLPGYTPASPLPLYAEVDE